MKAQKDSRNMTLLFPKLGARRRVGGQHHSATIFPPVRALVPIGTGWWAPGPAWIEKILAPHRDSKPGLPSP